MCCCGKKKVVPDDDPTLFRWDKYRKMADAWRAYKDEQYNVGIKKYLKKIPCGDCLCWIPRPVSQIQNGHTEYLKRQIQPVIGIDYKYKIKKNNVQRKN